MERVYSSCQVSQVPINSVERTASQPTGRVAGGGVRGGWLAFAHFSRSATAMRTLLFLLLFAAMQSCFAAPDINVIAVSDWSEPVADSRGYALRGRLLISCKERDTAVYVELQDASGHVGGSMAVYFDGEHGHDFRPEYKGGLNCELRDAEGKIVPQSPFAFSGACPNSCWIMMPSDSTVRLRANCFGIGRPKGDGLAISVPGKYWVIPAGDTRDYFLSGSFTVIPPKERVSFPDFTGLDVQVWRGTLTFPKMKISVKKP